MNQSAIDRGLFRATYVKKQETTIQKNQSTSQDDVFIKPDRSKVAGMRHGTYDKLNEKGYAPEETVIVNEDIIIGKISPIQPIGSSNKTFKDNSEVYKSQVPGTVDRVWTGIYNNDGYEMRKMRIRSEREPIIGDKFCLKKDTEVLTEKGWITIDKVTKDDKVATLVDDQYIQYEKPIDVYNFKYNGEMYKYRSEYVDLDVTMNHDLYVKMKDKFELVPAKDIIGKQATFKRNCINRNPDIEIMEIEYNGKTYKYNMDAFLALFGYIIKYEGYKSAKYNNVIDNKYVINSMFGFNWKEDKVLEYYFKNVYNGNSLPKVVFNLSQRQCKLMISMMNHGLNHIYLKDLGDPRDVSKLRENIIKLLIHAGISYDYDGYNEHVIKISKYNHIIKRNPKHKRRVSRDDNVYVDGEEETYHYDGNVYCLEVPSHVFMIRQNGKNVWVGNCSRAAQKGTIGIILPASDMPFTKDGIQPDIILNPNAMKKLSQERRKLILVSKYFEQIMLLSNQYICWQDSQTAGTP